MDIKDQTTQTEEPIVDEDLVLANEMEAVTKFLDARTEVQNVMRILGSISLDDDSEHGGDVMWVIACNLDRLEAVLADFNGAITVLGS